MGYILITGAEIHNKGAQSMMFISVDELKRRFPDKEIVVISDYDSVEQYKLEKDGKSSNYNFMLRDGTCLYGWLYKIIQRRHWKLDYYGDAKIINNNLEMIIDISGYALGSNFGWYSCLMTAYRAQIAKRHNIPIYYMPQSFGPFSWKNIKERIVGTFVARWLPYAGVIYAREEEGRYQLVENFNLNNVRLSDDLVLQNKGINLNNIFIDMPSFNAPEIMVNSVAIIPNSKNERYGEATEVIKSYATMIESILKKGKTIYVMRHSRGDLYLCRKIKNEFANNNNVILLEDDLECYEYENIVGKFDFIIASRYHSIIHAYRQGVPCIVLGWATKYHDLLDKMEQLKYFIDVRNMPGTSEIYEVIDEMYNRYKLESALIQRRLVEIQQKNVFDSVIL